MKTREIGGQYDFARRAFDTVDDMAYYIGRSPSYCQQRLTGGKEFTPKELDELYKAVKFYDMTDIEPVKFQKIQKKLNDPERFIYSLVWSITSAGGNMVKSVLYARTIAAGLFPDVEDSGTYIDRIYELAWGSL
jgi:hypothetical protein